MENTLAYIHDHCEKEIRMEELAARAYISKGYLSRVFKEITGKTVIQVVQEARMERACTLLKTSNLPVAEIAAAVGYSDLKYFYELFSDHFGLTPGAFRERK